MCFQQKEDFRLGDKKVSRLPWDKLKPILRWSFIFPGFVLVACSNGTFDIWKTRAKLNKFWYLFRMDQLL